jgi:hypothetical protein
VQPLFSQLSDQIKVLADLTEAKIGAVTGRRPERLLELLQSEIDPMHALDRFADEVERLTPEERQSLRRQIEQWQVRTDYLQQLLQQNLGYIDFLRSLWTSLPDVGLNLDL